MNVQIKPTTVSMVKDVLISMVSTLAKAHPVPAMKDTGIIHWTEGAKVSSVTIIELYVLY